MASGKTRQRKSAAAREADIGERQATRHFRFFDNREKYLLFVTTCSEKWVVAERIGRELRHLHPTPPALKMFDAGVGDGTVLTRVMRQVHRRFPTVPLLIVAKEISLEDVRLCLDKLPDRFVEHPQTVIAVTNMYYGEAPSLIPGKAAADAALNWYDVPLRGTTAHEFDEQILDLQPMLSEGWRSRPSEKSGNPLYLRPSVMVLYREDHAFSMKSFIPSRGGIDAAYDLIIASQPYRARMPSEIKARNVLVPLARAVAPGGRMIVIQGRGKDPGMEIINRIWPDEKPFQTTRRAMLDALRKQIGRSEPDLNYQALADARSVFRYHLHTLPSEVDASIGTSTLMAAWNAAVYVAQIEDERLGPVLADGRYIEATREVLHKHGGLWFNDESFIVSRKRP